MAYIDPETLTCPKCNHAGPIKWVVGVGPHTKKGEGPMYVDIADAGDWVVTTDQDVPKNADVISCPVCETTVKGRHSDG